MNGSSVLLISKHPLFAEAVAQLLGTANIVIAATVHHTDDVWSLLQTQEFSCIVVEVSDVTFAESDFISRIFQLAKTQQIIMLDSDTNRMIVHRREYADSVTARDLILALQDTSPNHMALASLN